MCIKSIFIKKNIFGPLPIWGKSPFIRVWWCFVILYEFTCFLLFRKVDGERYWPGCGRPSVSGRTGGCSFQPPSQTLINPKSWQSTSPKPPFNFAVNAAVFHHFHSFNAKKFQKLKNNSIFFFQNWLDFFFIF